MKRRKIQGSKMSIETLKERKAGEVQSFEIYHFNSLKCNLKIVPE